MTVISLRNVTVSYREDVALRGVSVDIGAGEMVGIVGPNGAGKTTILTVVNGLGRLLSGEAVVLGCRMRAGRGGRLPVEQRRPADAHRRRLRRPRAQCRPAPAGDRARGRDDRAVRAPGFLAPPGPG